MFLARLSVLAFGLFITTTPPLAAEPLPRPQDEVILTVSGAIDLANANAGGEAQFDLPMLKALGVVEVETTTMWTDGPQRFEGVPLRAVLDRLGASGSQIEAMALNDYLTTIPTSDAEGDVPILAFAVNGATMSVREKGPLWVIYPYDRDPDRYRTELIHSRSIWQLTRLTILP
jgi:hypothetical protein